MTVLCALTGFKSRRDLYKPRRDLYKPRRDLQRKDYSGELEPDSSKLKSDSKFLKLKNKFSEFDSKFLKSKNNSSFPYIVRQPASSAKSMQASHRLRCSLGSVISSFRVIRGSKNSMVQNIPWFRQKCEM